MFNGLITHQGFITQVENQHPQMRVEVQVDEGSFWEDVRIGDSIAMMGCCLTVVALKGSRAYFDLSAETLACTQLGTLSVGDWVHLEKALRFGDRLQGHLLLGHVDEVGTVIHCQSEGECLLLQVQVLPETMKYMAVKGSIAINGVSLTVNRSENCTFWVNLIPHTLEKTQLGSLKQGSFVNIEVDPLARYIEHLIAARLEHAV